MESITIWQKGSQYILLSDWNWKGQRQKKMKRETLNQLGAGNKLRNMLSWKHHFLLKSVDVVEAKATETHSQGERLGSN